MRTDMEYKNYTAKTADEAITQACLDLGVTSDRLEYDVIQEATSGFLGIGSKPAVIRARARSEEELRKEAEAIERASAEAQNSFSVKQEPLASAGEAAAAPEEVTGSGDRIISSDEIEKRAAAAAARARTENPAAREPRPERAPEGRRKRDRFDGRRGGRGRDESRFERAPEPEAEPVYHEPSRPKPERVVKARTEEEAEKLKKTAEDFLRSVFESMGITAEISTEYSQEEGAVSCTFDGEEMGILIGKRGQTLDSLQYLTSLVVNKKTEDYVRVKLDTEDYRARRAETLGNLARNIAYKVKKTHRPVSLEPMNPYERRIIHSALQGNRFVETYSEGEEPYRHVVVTPKR